MKTSFLQLQDFFNMNTLFDLIENWSKGTGFSAFILDNKDKILFKSSNISPICELIQKTKNGASKCKCTWDENESGIKKCHAGFYNAIIPIILSDGSYLGKIIFGQIIPKEASISTFQKKLSNLNISEEYFSNYINTHSRLTLHEIKSSYLLLKEIIDSLIEKNYTIYMESEQRITDYTLLSAAIKSICRITMFFNITKNEYHLIDHDYGVSNIVPLSGSIDEIVNIGVKSIPNQKQANEYYEKFNREALLKSYNNGIRELSLQHQQKTYDGKIHWMEGRLIFVETKSPDLMAICLSRIIDDGIQSKILLDEALKKSIQQQKLLQDALDKYKQAEYDSRRDFLTGLRNRKDLFDLINDELSGKRKLISSMFMIDIDDFKKLNDSYGHATGDTCLNKIGLALKEFEVNNEMSFYRYGGEEFLGICFASNKIPKNIADELLSIISNISIETSTKKSNHITVSIGYTAQNNDLTNMINYADKAMYYSKNNGKNQANCYDDLFSS